MCGNSGKLATSAVRPPPAAGWLASLALSALVAAPADAHGVSLGTGTLWVASERVELRLELPLDDALHVGGVRFAPRDQRIAHDDVLAACAALGAHVRNRFSLWDEAGERIALRIDGVTCARPTQPSNQPRAAPRWSRKELHAARVELRLSGSLPGRPAALTLQQTLLDDQPGHGSQLVLAVRGSNAPPGSVLLTNRGNAETLLLDWSAVRPDDSRNPDPAPASQPAGSAAPARPAIQLLPGFREVQAIGCMDDAGLHLTITAPLVLLETWEAASRAERDRLCPSEQAAAGEQLAAFIAGRLRLLMDDEPMRPRELRSWFIAPSAEPPGCPMSNAVPAERRPLGAWSARLVTTLTYSRPAESAAVRLEWGLFNAAVFEAQVRLGCGGREASHLVTTYAPRIEWRCP